MSLYFTCKDKYEKEYQVQMNGVNYTGITPTGGKGQYRRAENISPTRRFELLRTNHKIKTPLAHYIIKKSDTIPTRMHNLIRELKKLPILYIIPELKKKP